MAQPGYWGWKHTATQQLHSPFTQLPLGFGCSTNCSSVTSCGGNRDDVLCGGCKQNFSFAFFDKACVSQSECAAWKIGPLVVGAFTYTFLFSVYLIYTNEVAARDLALHCNHNDHQPGKLDASPANLPNLDDSPFPVLM